MPQAYGANIGGHGHGMPAVSSTSTAATGIPLPSSQSVGMPPHTQALNGGIPSGGIPPAFSSHGVGVPSSVPATAPSTSNGVGMPPSAPASAHGTNDVGMPPSAPASARGTSNGDGDSSSDDDDDGDDLMWEQPSAAAKRIKTDNHEPGVCVRACEHLMSRMFILVRVPCLVGITINK